jgi:hypothetical protein
MTDRDDPQHDAPDADAPAYVDGAIYPGPTGRLWPCQVLPDGTVDFIPLE